MRIREVLIAATMGLALTNCANVGNLGDYCSERPLVCILAGAAVVAGGVWLISEWDDDDNDSYSDARLKRDIREVGALPNGLKLYAFRYWNDDRTFVSVLAQDLLKDPRFSHAVTQDEKGYYMVDFGKINMGIAGRVAEFREASSKAVQGL